MDARIATWLESVNATPGWSPTSSISLPFARSDGIAAGPAIDLANLLVAQRDSDFANDAVTVIDLETGLPVPLDFDKHLTSFVLNREVALNPSDTKRDSTSLLVETEDERYDSVSFTFNPTRTDDGASKEPPSTAHSGIATPTALSTFPCTKPDNRAHQAIEELQPNEPSMVPVRQTISFPSDVASNRLRIKPRRPLREHDLRRRRHPSTSRQRRSSSSVRSPFPQPFPPSQEKTAKRLRAIFSTEGLDRFRYPAAIWAR
ncbi:MAG: hypothetical protein QM784_08720, partial [Polyangiaceae bacterium]